MREYSLNNYTFVKHFTISRYGGGGGGWWAEKVTKWLQKKGKIKTPLDGVREGETPQEEVGEPPPRIGHDGLAALPIKGLDGLATVAEKHDNIHN